jgi:hypothetical protein
MSDIQVGDVVLDLAQGCAMHVLEEYDGTAAEWSAANGYELTENYGNDRLGASDGDAVFECVYCNAINSEPSKTYAFPESRLARVETEAADDGRPVAQRVMVELLAHIRKEMLWRHDDDDILDKGLKTFSAAGLSAARHVGMSEDAIGEATELSQVELKAMREDDADA